MHYCCPYPAVANVPSSGVKTGGYADADAYSGNSGDAEGSGGQKNQAPADTDVPQASTSSQSGHPTFGTGPHVGPDDPSRPDRMEL